MITKQIKDRSSGKKPSNPAPLTVEGFSDHGRQKWVRITQGKKSELVPYGAFVTDRQRVWTELADKGLFIVSRFIKSDIVEKVEALSKFPRRVIFSHPGWCEGQFANASGRVFSPEDVESGSVAFVPHRTKCSRRGTHARWLVGVADLIKPHPIPSFFVMTAFAAPMLDLSGRTDNIGYELAGEGGKGKTTTQRAIASTVGPAMEKDRGYITTFLMTPAALERSMRWHSDMPFIIDEANLFGSGEGGRADRRKMRDFSFAMSSGTTKGRFDSPDQEGYKFVVVTSANEPFNELLVDTHNDVANAATDRLLPIIVPESDAGVFGPLQEGFGSYRELTLALETGMAEQYGSAMPKFLTALVQARHTDEEGLRRAIRRKIDEFKAEVGINENNGSDVRVAEAFGLVYAAGSFARSHGVLPADFDCLGAAKFCYANFRNTVPIRQPLRERLTAIARRPETLTIDRRNLPDLTDHELASAGALLRDCKGEMLLLMTTAFGQRMFPDWNALRGTADFIALNRCNDNGRGRGFHCRVRTNKRADWFYAFALPPKVVELLPQSERPNR